MKISNQNERVKINPESSIKNTPLFEGKHLILEIYGCNYEKLNDEPYLRYQLNSAAKQANALVLNIISNKFEPYGVTAIALLAESHVSIHTWPESKYAAIDIFTCGINMKPYLASQFLIETLEASKHILKTITREHPEFIENQVREIR